MARRLRLSSASLVGALLPAALLALSAGCGSETGATARAVQVPAGDAGIIASPDVGGFVPVDASAEDAGEIVVDAGAPDTGEIPDAGIVDAGAGDSGTSDAGTWDAGQDADAGMTPQILSPPSGTRLKATIETFTWSPGADEYWLDIGTSLGGSDVYHSPSLGTATDQRVEGLPLDGARLYVQLRARIGDRLVSATAEYDASFRKGLCVVADFADTRLEDFQGRGIKSLADVDYELRRMETHWNWLSRGKEVAQWDRIRVTLAQRRTTTAFNGWIPYREEVARLVKQQIAVSDYDVDRDGVIDGMWIIAPDKGVSYDFLVGGASRNNGANIFVDGQSGGAAVGHATGCFNHEFGHCVGLPDLYGPYGTVSGLTIMASPWEDPQNDFCAFDRYKLGWSKPRVIDRSRSEIVLHSAHTTLESVLIPTTHSYEYFLVEYRQKPNGGFGSVGAGDGLAVYHVFEAASQQVDPPLLKLEPADGTIVADAPLEAADFLLPGTPGMHVPLELKSYLGDVVIARIDNLTAPSADALQFDVTITNASGSLGNLLPNSGVESDYELWFNGGWKPWAASYTWDSTVGHGGSSHSLAIESPVEPNDVEWHQRVYGLTPRGNYLLCGWLKGRNITPYDGAGAGANVGLSGTFDHTWGGLGTFDWTEHCMTFMPTQSYADISCRLGGFGSTVTGKMWCDDLTLAALRSAF